MYRMNLLLKFIFTLLTIAIVVIVNNRIVLWLLLLLLTFYNLYKNNKASLFVDLMLVLFLGFSKEYEIFLIIFKLLFLINLLLTIYKSLNINEKELLVKDNKSNRISYYEKVFEKIVENINEKKQWLYDDEVSIDDRIERDLERSYLQSKIRYYNYSINKRWYNWNRIDTLILLLLLVLFVILFILR